MSTFEIPLSPTPQRFTISLAGINYDLKLLWNYQNSAWQVDFADANGVPILSGVPLVTGADLLDQFAYLGIGGHLICQTDHNLTAPPTFDNLGLAGHVYFVTP